MFDLSYVKVYTKNNEYVGKAERVVAVHPYAELLGSAKDLAEYKQQQKAVKKQIKDRIQPVKKVLRDIYEANVVNENRFKRTKPNLIAVNDDIPKLKITCYGE